MTSERQRTERVLKLSGFFWGLGLPERPRLQRTLHTLLSSDEAIPDRDLILQAVERTWPDTRPSIATHVEAFYRQRPNVANRPGAYGV